MAYLSLGDYQANWQSIADIYFNLPREFLRPEEFLLVHRKSQMVDAWRYFDCLDLLFHRIRINTMMIKCPKNDRL